MGLLALLCVAVFATLNLALRITSRARLSSQLERHHLGDALGKFAHHRAHYILATGAIRAAAKVLLFITVLYFAGALNPQVSLWHLVPSGVIAWMILLLVGVAIPNAWAKYSGDWLIVSMLPVLAMVRILCYPLLLVMGLFDPVIRRLAGVPAPDAQSHSDALEQEILNAISEGERHGAVDEEEKEMIESVIEFSDIWVQEIMTPRTDIVAVPKDAPLDLTLKLIAKHGLSRLPVFDGTIDKVLGVLYAKDLLSRNADEPFDATKVMRPALFVPESKPVRDMLREFQANKVHIAIVLDEYGGTAGLVTIEDILEEIVGEISDEYEPMETVAMKRITDQTVEVDARMNIHEINDVLGIGLPEEQDYETIGGFVFSTMGKIPRVGESCQHQNVDIQVIGAEPRRVTRLRVTVQPPVPQEPMPS